MVTERFGEQVYEVYQPGEMADLTFELARLILQSAPAYNRVVALARGGVSIAQSVADLIGVKNISVIQSELYTGIGTKAKGPIMTQPLSVSIKGEKVLLVDDLADSGESMIFARDYLLMHGPLAVMTATLATKPWTTYQPDFSVFSSQAWIIFPWETRETIQTLLQLWSSSGISEAEIHARLTALGYSKLQIETFARS